MKRKTSKKLGMAPGMVNTDSDELVYESEDDVHYEAAEEATYDYDDDGSQWGLNKRLSKKEQRGKAARMVTQLEAEGYRLEPAKAANGRQIALSYWGASWCEHLKNYSDYQYRLERGRSYLRTGSVVDLKIASQKITAKVSGHALYDVEVDFMALDVDRWQGFVKKHSAKIQSLADLLEGALPENVLAAASDPGVGLFPNQTEIKFWCACPDHADMCKHVAAVLYGVGARLDDRPEDFFILRGVNVNDLLKEAGHTIIRISDEAASEFDKEALEELFQIDIQI